MLLEQNGTVSRKKATWNVTRFEGAGLSMFMTIVPRVTCDGNGKPRNGQKSCISPGDVCRGTLKRIDAFTADRCMFGGDWPLCTLGAGGTTSYADWARVIRLAVAPRSMAEQRKILYENAVRVYGL